LDSFSTDAFGCLERKKEGRDRERKPQQRSGRWWKLPIGRVGELGGGEGGMALAAGGVGAVGRGLFFGLLKRSLSRGCLTPGSIPPHRLEKLLYLNKKHNEGSQKRKIGEKRTRLCVYPTSQPRINR